LQTRQARGLANVLPSYGYGGANVREVELEVLRLPDGGAAASCHGGMTPSSDTFIALAIGSPVGRA
jgi:hypothetical protein